ncbi:MAG: rhodanese-like domain-containing protein [Bacteroidetes bacterium]|nr:rhodanese-like domain-containing protein [Bacteroidota bacterium]
MIQLIKNILGLGPKVSYAELLANGGIIIDVRTKEEYQGGHVRGSINIPLNQLSASIKKLKNKDQAIITCCASGMRSANAKSILKGEGFTNVHNGGSWYSLRKFEK